MDSNDEDNNAQEEHAGNNNQEDRIIYVDGGTVDTYMMNVISEISKNGNVTLRSKGNSIPTAVSIANVITYEMLKGRSQVKRILLDTDDEPGIGHMTSTAEIVIAKNQAA